jgi:hypothetical protein
MVVIETREKTYYEKQFERGQEIMVPVGAGFETVHEERWCQECIGPYEKPTRIAVEARRHGR